MKTTQKAGETPAKINASMIDQDLKNGVNKTEMSVKYGIKAWEVERMFEHPLLKGRRPSRRRPLSFIFVDDMTDAIDPNQVTLEDAIDEAIESVEGVKEQMQETQEAIVEILSPTEYETPEESSLKGKTYEECLDAVINESTGETLKDALTHPDFEDQFDREENDPEYQEYRDSRKEQEKEEDELEMDDDTFEL